MNSKSISIWVIVIGAIAAAMMYSNSLKSEKKALNSAENAIKQSELKERYKRGAYVDNESILSDYETTKTIIYPGKSEFGNDYDEMYDTTCLVYTNNKLGQSKVKCSGLLFNDEDSADMQDMEYSPKQGILKSNEDNIAPIGEAAAAAGDEISATGQYPLNEKVIGLESELAQKESANNVSDTEWITDKNGHKYKIIGYREIEPSAK